MVTVAEARQQLQAARAQIAAAALPRPTAAQVRARTREQLQARQLETQRLAAAKTAAEAELVPFEAEIERVERAAAPITLTRRAFDLIQRKAEGKRITFGGSDPLKREFERLLVENKELRDAVDRGAELKGLAIQLGLPRGVSELRELVIAGLPISFQPKEPPTVEIPPTIREPITRRALAPTITTIELPPRKIIGRKITFGQPERFAQSFRQATGAESFTLAVPLRRQNGKLFVQDFNFLFEDGQLVRSRPTGSALLTEKQFFAADKRRRDKNPGFSFGDTRLVQPVLEEVPGIPTREKQLLTLEEQGLTPIFVGGKLTGFEDRIGNQTVRADQLNVIGIDRLKALQRAGILTFQEIPISETINLPPFSPLPQPKSVTLAKKIGNLLVGEEGKSLLRIGLVAGVPGGSITVSQFNQILRQTGLPGKVATQFIPETPLEVGFFAGTAGLATAAGLTGKIAKGVIFGLGAATAASPSLPKEERIAGGIIAVAPLVPFLVRRGLRIGGKKGQTSLSRFGELEEFFAKRKKEKSDLQNALDDFASQLKVKRVGKKVRDTTLQEKLSLVRKSVNEILKNPDPALRKAQAEGLVKLLKAELGDVQAKSLVNEFISQEGLTLRQAPIGRSVVGNLRQESAKFFIPLTVKDVKIIQKVPGITTPEVRVRLTPEQRSKINITDFQKRQELTLEITTELNRFKELVVQQASPRTLETTRQKIQTLTLQRSQTNQASRERLARVQLLETRQIQRQRLLLKQGLISKQKFRSGIRQIRRRRRMRVPIPKLKPIVKKKPKVRLRAPPSEFGIFVRKRGKDIKIGSRKTKPAARKFLKKRLTTTLRASGFIVDRKGKKLRPKISKGFRISKTDPFRIVEKRGRRLDTRSEVKAIQKAKASKPKLKSTPMIRMKRKRK